MVLLFNIFYQFGDSLAFLLLAAIGLAVFLEHKDLAQIYNCWCIWDCGSGKVLNLPLPIAMAFGIPTTVIFGLILEKLIIRYLYGRPLIQLLQLGVLV